MNPVTGLSSSPTDLTFEQTASPGGFFVYRARDYDSLKWDLKKILCRLLSINLPNMTPVTVDYG
ncbi:hypothetical protein JMUB7510_30610 [Staphylococcus aureus]